MDTNKITTEDVKKIAELSRLKLTEKELEEFAEKFTDTLEYMDMLDELDTDGVDETYQVTGLTNVFQNGEVIPSLTKEAALMNADEVIDDYFSTKGVFERSQ